jgi:hypothetical protein
MDRCPWDDRPRQGERELNLRTTAPLRTDEPEHRMIAASWEQFAKARWNCVAESITIAPKAPLAGIGRKN